MTDQMTYLGVSSETVSGWLTGSTGPLFATLHLPPSGLVNAAAVVCPPLQFEHYAAFSALREAADALALAGVAALRIDYWATGDSGGEPAAADDVSIWSGDVAAAAEALRRAGAPLVGWVGMRMGAVVAGAAAGPFDFRVLWDPCESGRRYLRESTLLARQVLEASSPVGVPDAEFTGVIGYDFPASFVDSLSALRMADAGPASAPTLLLTRDGRIPAPLSGLDGPRLDVRTAERQEDLLTTYLDVARVPVESIAVIAGWCAKVAEGSPATRLASVLAPSSPVVPGVTEEAVRIGPHGLFGIMTSPAGEPRLTLVCLNSGAQHRIGPNRIHVDLARRLGGCGVRTIRVDQRAIGDSPPGPGPRTSVHWPIALDDLAALVDAAAAWPEPVAAMGLCSGAYLSLEAAAAYPLAGVLAIHPGLDFGPINDWPELHDERRRIWVADRPWLRRLNRHWRLRRIVDRIPSGAWAVLDRVGLQPDLASGLLAAAERGPAQIVVVVERHILALPRMAGLRRPAGDRLQMVESTVDHSLVAPSARRWVLDHITGPLLEWRAPIRP